MVDKQYVADTIVRSGNNINLVIELGNSLLIAFVLSLSRALPYRISLKAVLILDYFYSITVHCAGIRLGTTIWGRTLDRAKQFSEQQDNKLNSEKSTSNTLLQL